ncbi:hypothetical protein SAMN06264849_1079 [Melghirimyces algeriensis]|uniref:Uncharacterized protein n=1 Tax=Melghirimyces algeriensis TaxID=910412 RepID=A0A521DV56_9BACL|nr:hypothetical protein SAMN06264849_1079 [Melghirimyces algeriensis]
MDVCIKTQSFRVNDVNGSLNIGTTLNIRSARPKPEPTPPEREPEPVQPPATPPDVPIGPPLPPPPAPAPAPGPAMGYVSNPYLWKKRGWRNGTFYQLSPPVVVTSPILYR